MKLVVRGCKEEETVELWLAGCHSMGGVWDVMNECETWQSNACYSNHFPCEYLDACWTYNLDREKMKAGGLVQVARLNKQILADSQEE